jgi:hypothetical protein
MVSLELSPVAAIAFMQPFILSEIAKEKNS